jgi:cytochrome d ubiquinol oxidase subunit II
VLAAIGPVWDGNEVWLVASGGILVFAFPRAYAVAFSGFYLPLMLVLWLLIGRGLSIELRGQLAHPLWRSFWDFAFAGSSTLLALVLGAALGNVIRGVRLGREGVFVAPLFTDFRAQGKTGALDWYTLTVAAFAVAALVGHGALYLCWKTDGPVRTRAARIARVALPATLVLMLTTTGLTALVQPRFFATFAARPWAWPLPVAAVAAETLAWVQLGRGRERGAFLGSVAFLALLFSATAATLYPILLRSTIDPAFDVTAQTAASGRRGLIAGLGWWIPALALAVAYFVYLFQSFRGKVKADHY